MNTRSALLLGATGRVGRCCLEHLLADPRYASVTSVDERPLDRRHPKLAHYVVEGAEALLRLAGVLRGQDVFSCPHVTLRRAGSSEAFYRSGCTYPQQAARMALLGGAEQYLFVSSVGADAQSPFLHLRIKGEMEEALRTLAFPGGAYSFRAPLLASGEAASGEAHAPGAEGPLREALEQVSFAMAGTLRRHRPMPADVLARSMVRVAAQRPGGYRTYEPDTLRIMAEMQEWKQVA